ncbi:membrane fusion protein, multidrug efflux system [Thermoflavifilum thermophilum]|uniref:Membrane fusion protein, multidrug efflux system n=2 Tax=Thermoflavifilum thermophilum TaxID=1393122 RepID=A0A1I7N234_9BACT|nr:membrane fusion protein, multidrug efflux system [Thermoflavifilum thermophilum]
MNQMRYVAMKMISTLAVGSGMALLFAGCHRASQAPQMPQAIPVSAIEVHTQPATYYQFYPGTIRALNVVQLHGDVSGYITGIFFKDGQFVEKGQKLYEIDRQQYEAAYQQALANLQVAQANLERAKQDAERYQELAQKNAIAKQTLDHALSDLRSAEAQVAAAKANVNQVATNLKYSRIVAPFSGIIGISQVKLGSLVTPGQTLLNTISSYDPMAVDFQVDQKEIPHFSDLLAHAAAHRADSTFMIQLADGTLYPEPATISVIDRAVDPQTGTITVRLLVPNRHNLLRDGMNCNVRVANYLPASTILIPQVAVTEQLGEYFVYVVQGDSVVQRKIALGYPIGGQYVVQDGLKPGEKVVTQGIQRLRQGAHVIVSTSAAAERSSTAPASSH